MIVLDTNLLIYAHRENSPEHDCALAAIIEAVNHPQGWGMCLPSVAEFWSIVTRRGIRWRLLEHRCGTFFLLSRNRRSWPRLDAGTRFRRAVDAVGYGFAS